MLDTLTIMSFSLEPEAYHLKIFTQKLQVMLTCFVMDIISSQIHSKITLVAHKKQEVLSDLNALMILKQLLLQRMIDTQDQPLQTTVHQVLTQK